MCHILEIVTTTSSTELGVWEVWESTAQTLITGELRQKALNNIDIFLRVCCSGKYVFYVGIQRFDNLQIQVLCMVTEKKENELGSVECWHFGKKEIVGPKFTLF